MSMLFEHPVKRWVRETFHRCDAPLQMTVSYVVFGVLIIVAGTLGIGCLIENRPVLAAINLTLCAMGLVVPLLMLIATDWEEARRRHERSAERRFDREYDEFCALLSARFNDITLDADTRETAIEGRQDLVRWHNLSIYEMNAEMAREFPPPPRLMSEYEQDMLRESQDSPDNEEG